MTTIFTSDTADDSFLFLDKANEILNMSLLKIKDFTFRICEIEFYKYSADHRDDYVHKNKEQMKKGFYFHKYKNGTLKSGKYKGLDITYGEVGIYYGVLIRAIYDIDKDIYVEGPCKTVNYIMEKLDLNVISEIAKLQDESSIISIVGCDNLQKEQIKCGPRIGLSDKYPMFKNKHYRYVIMDKVKKDKGSLQAL